jgi:elongation factor Tu
MGIFDGLFGKKNGSQAPVFIVKAEMIFSITGRGTLVTGKVETGAIASGETVYFTSPDGEKRSCRVEVELDQETYPGVQKASAGMNAGILLLGAERSEIGEDTVISGSPQ